MRTNLATSVVVSALIASINCSGSTPTAPTSSPQNPIATTPVSSLTILYGSTSCQPLRAGRSLSVSAYTPESSRVYQSVTRDTTWITSDASVLMPSTTRGFIQLVGPGTAELRAEYQGTFAALAITVLPGTYPMLDVSVQGSVLPGASQPTGRAMTHRALAVPSIDVSAATTFTSSDTRIATVVGPSITFKPVVGNVVITGTQNGMVGSGGIAVYPRPY